MLSNGSGCSPMTSSPLISPRLWESRLTLLKVWRPPRPSGRCTCAGHLWRWWVVYAPNFPGSTTWLCEPPLACLFPCHSCALHTLSRDLQVWRRGYLVPLAFRRSLMFPEGNVPGYVCNPGSPRERDAASQGHTSGIPTRAMLHSWNACWFERNACWFETTWGCQWWQNSHLWVNYTFKSIQIVLGWLYPCHLCKNKIARYNVKVYNWTIVIMRYGSV